MKIYLPFIALVLCTVSAHAADSPELTSSPSSADSLSSWNYLSGTADEERLLFNEARDPNHRYVRQMPTEVTCLKMRSYLMAREGSDTDVTRMVGYRTCTKSAKFDLRLSYTPAQPAEH